MDEGNALLAAGGRDWAYQQLADAGYESPDELSTPKAIIDVVMAHIEASPRYGARILPVIIRLLNGQPLEEQHWSDRKLAAREYTWVQVYVRSINPGDVVRVRKDAYTGDEAVHNGREGVVAGLRRGYIINYTDSADGARPTQMGFRHQADKLERRVPFRPMTRSDE